MPANSADPKPGLTTAELEILEHLWKAWLLFVELEPQTNLTLADFRRGIHQAQDQIALRVAARANPEIWSNEDKADRI